MGKLRTVITFALMLSTSAAVTTRAMQTSAPVVPSLTKEQWHQDLQYLAKELPRRHKNAFHTISKEQFADAVAQLDRAAPSLPSRNMRF